MSRVDELLSKLQQSPESVTFAEVIEVIEQNYHYTPTRFSNGLGEGAVMNQEGQNEGSCKLFAFGKLHNLSEEQLLNCFGSYYRVDVLANPHGNDHLNIRNFMASGWLGIEFFGQALEPKG